MGFYIAGQTPGKIDILKMVLPITTKKFWFVNAYLAMYLLSPFMNKLIHSLTKRQFEYLLVVLIAIFPLRMTFLPHTWSQDGTGGMSVLLFIVLYCIAAWLRLYYEPDKMRPTSYLAGYICTALFLVISKWVFMHFMSPDYASKLYGYSSVFTIFTSVCLFLFFLRVKQVDGKIGNAIIRIAPHSFAVYIIHFCLNSVIWTYVLHIERAVSNPWIGIFAVLGSCILVFSFCVIIDMIRTVLAKIIGDALSGKQISIKYNDFIRRWDRAVDLS